MTFIITGKCVRDGACAEVCPVECIQAVFDEDDNPILGQGNEKDSSTYAEALLKAGKNPYQVAYFIDPEACIDCGACVPECPTEAIYEDEEVPKEEEAWIKRNEAFFDTDAGGPGYG